MMDETFLIEEEWNWAKDTRGRDFGIEILKDMLYSEAKEFLEPIFEQKIVYKEMAERSFRRLVRRVAKSYAPDTFLHEFIVQVSWALSDMKDDFENDTRLEELKRYWMWNETRAHHRIESDRQNFDTLIAMAKKVPLERLIGKTVRRSGNNTLTTLCPLHDEKSPSFTIFQNTNTYYCFGCHAFGDSINLYEALNGVDFAEAVRALAGGSIWQTI